MNLLHTFYTPIKISNYTILYLSCWFRGKSAPLLPNDRVKAATSCVKNNMDFKTCGLKIVRSRLFFISNYLLNNSHDVVLAGVSIKQTNYINYVLVEFSYCQ